MTLCVVILDLEVVVLRSSGCPSELLPSLNLNLMLFHLALSLNLNLMLFHLALFSKSDKSDKPSISRGSGDGTPCETIPVKGESKGVTDISPNKFS